MQFVYTIMLLASATIVALGNSGSGDTVDTAEDEKKGNKTMYNILG